MENIETKQNTPVEETPVTETVEVQAAKFIATALPVFRAKKKKLEERNKAEICRMLTAIVEAPLENTIGKFTTPEADELFRLALMIQNSKHILFNSSLKVEEVQKEAIEKSVEESKLEENKGE